MASFSKTAKIITVQYDNRPVAAGLTIGFGNNVEVPWASALRKYNKQSPNMLLYWEMIKAACEDEYEFFDFGRSSLDAGTFKFKKQWGSEPQPLHWYYHLRRGEAPDVNPKSAKFSLLVNTWQKLPLPIANLAGPLITRHLP